MKLELRKAADGTGFVVCVCGEKTMRQIVIPLSQRLSGEIETMAKAEGIGMEKLILPPRMGRH